MNLGDFIGMDAEMQNWKGKLLANNRCCIDYRILRLILIL